MAATSANILASLRYDLDAFTREATAIREKLADDSSPKFFMSLFALLMGAFSQVDLWAALWAGSLGKGQTKRMRGFLDRYSGRESTASMLAVQLYRHTLMHTGRPRMLLNESTGVAHGFLLHWGRKRADVSVHYTVNADGKLTLNLECLIEDLSLALDRFIAEASADPSLPAQIEALWPSVMLQKFRP